MKKVSLYLVLFAAMCFAPGCAGLQVATEFISVNNSIKPCYDDLRAKPKYTALHEKLPVDTTDMPTAEQLADTDLISPQMKQLGMEWYSEHQLCDQPALVKWSNYDPEMGARVAGWLAEQTDIFNDALANNRTYGYINNRIKHLKERKNSDAKQVIRSQVQRKQAEQGFVSDVALQVFFGAVQILAARQQVIAQSQLAYRARVPTYKPVYIPQTACSRMAPNVTCTGGYTTMDYLGNMVDSRSSFTTKDYLGNLVDSRSSYTTRDRFGNLVDSRSSYPTLDVFGNLIDSQQ